MKLRTLKAMATMSLLAACGSTVPPELLSARTAYDRASAGPAMQLNPAGLHAAKETLDVAEHSYAEGGDSQETKDLAYTAERKAQIAEVRARESQASAHKEQVVTNMHAAQAAQVQLTSAELGRAKAQLGIQGQKLQSERERREDAERRAALATAALAGFATVKQEDRGLVITLSGGVLFESNKSELLASAQRKLDDVAKALNDESPDSTMAVEGHADSQGAAAHNKELSQRRADAVRAYLVSKGVAEGRITALGYGVERPIADNKSPEGRANNRRVEIVVKPAQQMSDH
jgi:outer membrane protein OmpA-like peptidoglycan-associated protein